MAAGQALPARFRRQRVLIVGCGDVGQRLLRLWQRPGQDARAARGPLVRALSSSPQRFESLRALGATPLLGNLDDLRSLRRLAGLAQRVVHLAPPAQPAAGAAPAAASRDLRTCHLLRALVGRAGQAPQLVYGSTSGVYGNWDGAWVTETHPLRASTARALRRVDAERQLRAWALRFGASGAAVHVLRIPGIYAGDREGGTPLGRLQRGTPLLRREDDVYTSHIHADDLARAVERALWRGRPQRITNVADDSAMPMGDYFDLAADLWRLPHPARISLAEAEQQLSPTLLSFMRESRRLSNSRMRHELGVVLRYQTVHHGLQAAVYLVGPGAAQGPDA
ncbi:NAD(P)-dependent oxidoreductase [Comamonas sp. JNW]|uniref:NAD-dependent epimerase/dehydratase family protein n=1 Tax=Comamonas sp. 23 TaxID=3415008 RepID=UPI000DE71235|nr:NAD(P)-dependent oxidoreductase [Comamonas sp. JNW]